MQIGANVSIDVRFYARLQLTADFEFSYSVFSGDTHLKMQFHGGYEVSFRVDATFDAYLQFTIAKLLQWSEQNSRVMWVGSVPVVYDPFMVMDVVVKTEPFALSAGLQFDVSQDFTVGWYYDRVWNDCVEKHYYTSHGCSWKCEWACNWWDHCGGVSNEQNCWSGTGSRYDCYWCDGRYEEDSGSIQEFGELTKSASVSYSVSSDDDGDGCPDNAQHFGFDIKPQIKVGAVFYTLVAVYAKPELVFPFRLTMPQSDGPTCGNGISYDLCSTSDPKEASWSIEGAARFHVGFHVQSLNDVMDRIWTQITGQNSIFTGEFEVLDYLEYIQEFQIGNDLSFGTLAAGCFDLPDFLDNLYSALCCSNENADVFAVGKDTNHDFMGWIPEHDDNPNAYEPMDQPVLEIEIPPKVALMALLVAVVFVMVMIYFVCFQDGTLRKQRGYRKVVYLSDVDSENQNLSDVQFIT